MKTGIEAFTTYVSVIPLIFSDTLFAKFASLGKIINQNRILKRTVRNIILSTIVYHNNTAGTAIFLNNEGMLLMGKPKKP